MLRGIFILACFVLCQLALAGTQAGDLKWLNENRNNEGVIVHESGLQYKVLREGPEGAPSPSVSTPCKTHYEGRLIDGTVFDSSYKRGEPTTFAPNQVIRGWTIAMQMMKAGDKWELYIPSELAYGDRQVGPHIKAGSALIFTMEIIEVLGHGDL